MAIIFHLLMWLGYALLVVFLVLATYRILTDRNLLRFMTVEEERAYGPLTIGVIIALLTIGYFGLSYLQGSLL